MPQAAQEHRHHQVAVAPAWTVAVAADKADALKKLSAVYLDILKNELDAKEKNLTVVLESVSTACMTM